MAGKRNPSELIILFATVAALATLAYGCSKALPRSIDLPSDLDIERQFDWALVTTAFVSLKTEALRTSPEAGKLSGGTVFAPKARKIDPSGRDQGGFWYLYEEEGRSGWIHEGDLSFHKTKGQALESRTGR